MFLSMSLCFTRTFTTLQRSGNYKHCLSVACFVVVVVVGHLCGCWQSFDSALLIQASCQAAGRFLPHLTAVTVREWKMGERQGWEKSGGEREEKNPGKTGCKLLFKWEKIWEARVEGSFLLRGDVWIKENCDRTKMFLARPLEIY